MGIDFSSLAILFSFLTFLAMILRVTTVFKSKSKWKLNLPPGPRKLPLIGNLHHFANLQPPHRILTELGLKHGPIMHLQVGEISTIVISSPEAAKEVLKTHDITFANRPSLVVAESLSFKNTDIVYSPYGEYWRQLRKICTIEMLSAKRVRSFRPIRDENFSNMCRWIASKAGSMINLTESIERTTLAVLLQATFGKKASEEATFLAMVREIFDLIGGFYIVDLYPSIKLFRLSSAMRYRVPRVRKMMDKIFENIIRDHQMANVERKHDEDLVDVLLKFNKPGHEDFYLTVDNIKAVLQDMFVAGTKTTSTTMDWAMVEMMRHPRVLEKAQDEVRQIFGSKGFVDESDFEELKYLNLVIKETLRMHPPGPLLIPRENTERREVCGYEIPTKTQVLVNVWAIGRDPKYWKEPNSFEPERFLDSPLDYKGNNFEYLPFGSGRRICPGISFAIASLVHPLAMLLFHFDWIFPDGVVPENLDMTESFGLAAKRKNPLHVIPIISKPFVPIGL